jgi:hypothetical protein
MDISTQISALDIDDALKNVLLKHVENQQQTINHQTDTIANQIQKFADTGVRSDEEKYDLIHGKEQTKNYLGDLVLM